MVYLHKLPLEDSFFHFVATHDWRAGKILCFQERFDVWQSPLVAKQVKRALYMVS